MALFTMPTPEQVRQQARNEAQQRATLFAQAPAGRAGVLAAGQAGGLFGQAIGEGLGGRLPGEEKAMKFQQVQQRVTQEIGDIDVSQPEGFYKMANLTAKYANEAGLPEIAQQAQVAALDVRKQFQAKMKDAFGPVQQVPGAPEGVVGQQNLASGEWDIKSKPEKPLVNIGTEKEAVKFSFSQLEAAGKDAKFATRTKQNLDFVRKAMKGIETGAFTDVRLNLNKVLASAGLPTQEDIPNLQAANTAMGNLVMNGLNNFPGQISNQERQFVAGLMPKLTQTKEGREQIIELLDRLANPQIDYHKAMQKYMSKHGNSLMPEGAPSFFEEWDAENAKKDIFEGLSMLKGINKASEYAEIRTLADGRVMGRKADGSLEIIE